MSQQIFWWVLFMVLCTGLIMLPLLPAWREWRQPSDVAPLAVVREHSGSASAFADSLRRRIAPHLPNAGPGSETGDGEGGDFVVLGEDKVLPPDLETRISPRGIIVATGDFAVPPGSALRHDLYAGGRLALGRGALLRAALGEGRVELEEEVATMRWLHSGGDLVAAAGCRLLGRASAEEEMVLGPEVVFQRLHAPHIRVGAGAPPEKEAPADDLPVFDPGGEALDSAGTTRLLPGDLALPPGHVLEVDVVVRGDLGLGAHSVVRGSVKAGRRLAVGEGVRIGGAAICSGDMVVGPRVQIGGPVAAEGRLDIGAGCRIGAPGRPSTVSAPAIVAGGDLSVFGTLWAREQGRTAKSEV